MAKRIKLTERQVKLLERIGETGNSKKIKITESQYNRLFNGKEELHLQEDGGLTVEFLTFANETIELLKNIMTDQSQAGLSPFWVKMGVTRGELFSTLSDLGIITAVTVTTGQGIRKVFKVRKKHLIRGIKALYNILSGEDRYDLKTGEVKQHIKKEGMVSLGNDIEIQEDGGYPAGAANDPNAPWNKDDEETPKANYENFNLIDEISDGNGYYLLFLSDELNNYVVIYNNRSSMFEEYCGTHTEADCIMNQLNHQAEMGTLEVGECGYDCGSHVIHVLNDEMKDYIMQYHANTPEIQTQLKKLMGVNETTTAGASSGAFEGPIGHSIRKGIRPSQGINESKGVKEEEIGETTSTGTSSGAYETPKMWAKDPKKSRFSKKPIIPGGEIIKGRPEKGTELSLYEAVAKKTGKTIAEVKQIIEKNKNKGQ